MRRPILLAGPTASGKSALALRLALRDGGLIVNADSMQVYECWRVLTARPQPAEMQRAEHALYGHVDCATRYSVGSWLRDLAPVLERARMLELRPIIVGGTGLYFDAAINGLSEIPPIPREVRTRSETMLAGASGLERMLADLERFDAATHTAIDRRNPMRVQRAWEVFAATGRGLSDWQAERAVPQLPRETCDCYVLEIETAALDARIAARFAAMIDAGALEECRRFLRAGLDRTLPSARALGAQQLFAHLQGTADLEAAYADAVVATRRYAKRQRTWMRNRMADWTRVPSVGDPLATIALD
jgi:tRNA dimethylallyltransferase